MAEQKKKRSTSNIKRNEAAKAGIEEIFATSPNKDKDDFVKVKPKKKAKQKKVAEKEIEPEKDIKSKKKQKDIVKEEVVEINLQDAEIILPTNHEIVTPKKIIMVLTILFILFSSIILVLFNQINSRVDAIDKKLKTPKTKIEYVNPFVMFFGDSITEAYDVAKHFGKESYLNNAVSGYQTYHVLDKLKEDVIDYQPSKAVLLIGTNDIQDKKDDEEILDNMEEIIKMIQEKSKNTKLYIQSILPISKVDDDKIDHDMVGRRTNKRIDALNKELEQLCQELKVNYINTNDGMKDTDGNLKIEYTRDGLHLTDEGYKKLTSILKKYLD